MRRLLFVLLLLLTGCSDGGQPKPESTTTRLTYDIVDSRGERSQQIIDVQRPYRARTITYRGKQSMGGFLWDESGTYTVAPDGGITKTAEIAPGFPGPASGLAVALPIALRQKLVKRIGPGTAGGKPCTVWQSSGPLDGSPFAPPSFEATESCVDEQGVIRSERWGGDTGLIQTRTLLSQGKGPSSLYDGKTPRPLPSALAVAIVKPSTVAELCKLLQIPVPADPPGLQADQAKAVLDVNERRTGVVREAGVMTWVGGGHLAVLRIERDLVAGGGRFVRGEPVQLAALGRGHLEPVLAGLRVVVGGPNGLRMIVTSDLPEDQLLSWLRTLRF